MTRHKTLGFVFHSDKSMDKHISAIVKSCFLQLGDFYHFRPLISQTAAISLAFVHPILTIVIVCFIVFLNTLFTANKK